MWQLLDYRHIFKSVHWKTGARFLPVHLMTASLSWAAFGITPYPQSFPVYRWAFIGLHLLFLEVWLRIFMIPDRRVFGSSRIPAALKVSSLSLLPAFSITVLFLAARIFYNVFIWSLSYRDSFLLILISAYILGIILIAAIGFLFVSLLILPYGVVFERLYGAKLRASAPA